MFRIKILIIVILSIISCTIFNCTEEAIPGGGLKRPSSKAEKEETGETEETEEKNTLNLIKAKAFKKQVGKSIYNETYNLKKEKEKAQLRLLKTLQDEPGFWRNYVKPLLSYLISGEDEDEGEDPILKQIEWGANSEAYNPLANYPSEMQDKDFKPCVAKEEFDRDYAYTLADSQNYHWIIAQVNTFNMGESDLSRNAFGNDKVDNEGDDGQHVEGTCRDRVFYTSISVGDIESLEGLENDNENSAEWAEMDQELRQLLGECLSIPTFYTNYIHRSYAIGGGTTFESKPITAGNKPTICTLTAVDPFYVGNPVCVVIPPDSSYGCDDLGLDSKGCVIMGESETVSSSSGGGDWASDFCSECYTSGCPDAPGGAWSNGGDYPDYAGHCFPLCGDADVINYPACYHKVRGHSVLEFDQMLNNRRRALMSNSPDSGLLYMSIKNPDDGNIYNVRVMHNLHQDSVMGDNNSFGPNYFSFPIPFCPKLETYYQYNVCNVPKSRHNNFGHDDDGNPKSIPHCFPDELDVSDTVKAEVTKWIISDVRVANERVGTPTWADMGEKWIEAYQWLIKTEFYFEPTSTYIDEDNQFEKFCTRERDGSSCQNSICEALDGDKGLRKLKKGVVKFRYTNYQEESDPDTEKGRLVLYFDTNPLPDHWFHPGWADEDGNRYADASSTGAIMKPATLTDSNYSCFKNDDSNLKPNVIHQNYSPLVINVNHQQGVTLVGLDAGVDFVGPPFKKKISMRKGTYDLVKYFESIYEDGKFFRKETTTPAWVRTGWIDGSKGDALLVYDLNQNGKIDSSFELFGEGTVMEKEQDWGRFGNFKKGSFASNGFIALGQYDDNADFVIDDKDTIWDDLRFWQDGKDDQPNGKVDAGELLTMDDLNIVSISIKKLVDVDVADIYGNRTKYRGSYQYMEDGKLKTNIIHDVFFVKKPYSRVDRTNIISIEE